MVGVMLIAIGFMQPVDMGLSIPGQWLPEDYYMSGVALMLLSMIGATLPDLFRKSIREILDAPTWALLSLTIGIWLAFEGFKISHANPVLSVAHTQGSYLSAWSLGFIMLSVAFSAYGALSKIEDPKK